LLDIIAGHAAFRVVSITNHKHSILEG
jgi:hypothetical protein